MPGGMGGEYNASGMHPFAFTDGPWQNQDWVNVGSGRSTARSDGSMWTPYDSYMAQSRGQGWPDTGQGALMPQTGMGLGGGLGGGQPFLGSIAPPQRPPMAAPAPLQPAAIPGGGGGGASQLANMQAMFGGGGAPGGMPPGGPMGGGGLLGQPRQNPMGIVQMGLGPRSNPYTAQQGGFRPTRGLL